MARRPFAVFALASVVGAAALMGCTGHTSDAGGSDPPVSAGEPLGGPFTVVASGRSGWTGDPSTGLGDGEVERDGRVDSSGPLAVVANGDRVLLISTDGTTATSIQMPGATGLYLTRPEPGLVTFVGTQAAWTFDLRSGRLDQARFDHPVPVETDVAVDGARLLVITEKESLDAESPNLPRTRLVRLVDIETGDEFGADELFPDADGKPVWVSGQTGVSLSVTSPGSGAAAIVRLDAADPTPVELPAFGNGGMRIAPDGREVAVASEDGELYVGEAGGDLGPSLASGVQRVLALTPLGAVVSFDSDDSAPVLVAPDGTQTDVPGPLTRSGNGGLLHGAGDLGAWYAAVGPDGIVELPEVRGMNLFEAGPGGWWFVADEVSATSHGSPVRVVDPATLDVIDLEGSAPEVLAAVTASFSADSARGIGRFQTIDGFREMRSVIVSVETPWVQSISVAAGSAVAFSDDTRWAIGRDSSDWKLIALSTDLSPQYRHLFQSDAPVVPLGWISP